MRSGCTVSGVSNKNTLAKAAPSRASHTKEHVLGRLIQKHRCSGVSYKITGARSATSRTSYTLSSKRIRVVFMFFVYVLLYVRFDIVFSLGLSLVVAGSECASHAIRENTQTHIFGFIWITSSELFF